MALHTKKNMKKILLLVVYITALASCKKDQNVGLQPEPQELSPDIKFAITGAANEPRALYEPSPTANFLGYGYDVTDRFNSEASMRASIVDINELERHGELSKSYSTQGGPINILGKDALDFSKRLSNQIDGTSGLSVFGKTIEAAFPETTFSEPSYVYAYYSFYWVRKTFSFFHSETYKTKYLTDAFRRDMAALSAKQIVEKYGTHVVTRVRVGSKFDVIYQAKASQGDREKIVREGQRYALKKAFGLSTGYLDEVDLTNLNANSSAKIHYSSVGGDISQLKPEVVNNRQFLNITNWLNSITDDNVRFIGVADKGMMPIYTFIDDNAKMAEVKAYIEGYLAERSVKLTSKP